MRYKVILAQKNMGYPQPWLGSRLIIFRLPVLFQEAPAPHFFFQAAAAPGFFKAILAPAPQIISSQTNLYLLLTMSDVKK